MGFEKNMGNKGFRRITDGEGSLQDIPPTWPGLLALLLRKITIDKYDGRDRENCIQMPDESMSYGYVEELLSRVIQEYNGNTLSEADLKTERTRLLTEFARPSITIKTFGTFLNMLDLNWAEITVTIQRKSGTIKSYTKHIGGIGIKDYVQPIRNQEFIETLGLHEDPFYPKHSGQLIAGSKKGDNDED